MSLNPTQWNWNRHLDGQQGTLRQHSIPIQARNNCSRIQWVDRIVREAQAVRTPIKMTALPQLPPDLVGVEVLSQLLVMQSPLDKFIRIFGGQFTETHESGIEPCADDAAADDADDGEEAKDGDDALEDVVRKINDERLLLLLLLRRRSLMQNDSDKE